MPPLFWIGLNVVLAFGTAVVGFFSMAKMKFPTSEQLKVSISTAAVAALSTWSFGEYGLFASLTTVSFMTVAMNYDMAINHGILGPRYAMSKEDRIGMAIAGVVMLLHFWWFPPFFYGGLLWTIAIGTLLFAAFAYRGSKE